MQWSLWLQQECKVHDTTTTYAHEHTLVLHWRMTNRKHLQLRTCLKITRVESSHSVPPLPVLCFFPKAESQALMQTSLGILWFDTQQCYILSIKSAFYSDRFITRSFRKWLNVTMPQTTKPPVPVNTFITSISRRSLRMEKILHLADFCCLWCIDVDIIPAFDPIICSLYFAKCSFANFSTATLIDTNGSTVPLTRPCDLLKLHIIEQGI